MLLVVICFMAEMAELVTRLSKSNNVKIIGETKNYLCLRSICGSKKQSKVPLKLSADLAYFVGAITGDGYLASANYRFGIHKANREYLCSVFSPLVYDLFDLKLSLYDSKRSFHMCVKNKVIWLMLNKIFELPNGKKALKVGVPGIIKKANSEIQKAYLAGLFDTDGGRRGRGYGFTTASKKMFVGSIRLLKGLGFNPQKDRWVNHKYNREYFGWKISKREEGQFFQQIPLKNTKKFGSYAGIPKRSKGHVLNSG